LRGVLIGQHILLADGAQGVPTAHRTSEAFTQMLKSRRHVIGRILVVCPLKPRVMQTPSNPVPLALAYWPVLLGLVNLLVVAASLTLAYRQLKRTHEWNRRKASQDLLVQLATGDVRDMRYDLEVKFGARIFEPKQTYTDVLSMVDAASAPELNYTARSLLNYYESIAIGIKNNVLEDDICFDFAASTLNAYWRWAQPLVQERQSANRRTWIEIEHLNVRWQQRTVEIGRAQLAQGRLPGRRPT
jgi:hypothetical protein